jgi:DNA repair protein RecO (recombination protein O)
MQHLKTTGIILRRVQYGEADRIVTCITPDHGKISFIAKGVRKIRSKLAGGVELFSVSEIVLLEGKSDLFTLTSARLQCHYGDITKDIIKTTAAYDMLKLVHTVTEDNADSAYFTILNRALEGLNDPKVDVTLVQGWFCAQILKISGHGFDLQHDAHGAKLLEGKQYSYDFEKSGLQTSPEGQLASRHIRALRMVFAGHPPSDLQRVAGMTEANSECLVLLQTLLKTHLPIPG